MTLGRSQCDNDIDENAMKLTKYQKESRQNVFRFQHSHETELSLATNQNGTRTKRGDDIRNYILLISHRYLVFSSFSRSRRFQIFCTVRACSSSMSNGNVPNPCVIVIITCPVFVFPTRNRVT